MTNDTKQLLYKGLESLADKSDKASDWLKRMKDHESEHIEDGLILETSDLINHFYDNEIWIRFVDSLTYLVQSRPYSDKAISAVAMMQQTKIVIMNNLGAQMAVSLIHPESLRKQMPKIHEHVVTYLLINPLKLAESILNDKTIELDDEDRITDYITGILIHEMYHIFRGDLLEEPRFHYNDPQKDSLYEKNAALKNVYMFGDEMQYQHTSIHTLLNILSDLSINTDITENISPLLMNTNDPEYPYMSKHTLRYLLEGSLNGTPLESGIAHMFGKTEAEYLESFDDDYERPHKFNIDTFEDYLDDDVRVTDKQYAILSYLNAHKFIELSDEDKEKAREKSQDEGGQGDGLEMPGGDDPITQEEISQAHEDALDGESKSVKDHLAESMQGRIDQANAEGKELTGGKSYDISAKHGLRDKILELRRVKALPKLDIACIGMIKQFNRRKKLNPVIRHLSDPKRLDICGSKPDVTEIGMHCYMDVSGSVTDEMIQNIFSIIMKTVKTEPVRLYAFASSMTEEPLDISKKTRLSDVRKFLNEANIGYGTTLTPVFDNMAQFPNQKHIIFSDFYFDKDELTQNHMKVLKKTPTILVAEEIDVFSYQDHFTQFVRQNSRYMKLVSIKNHIL